METERLRERILSNNLPLSNWFLKHIMHVYSTIDMWRRKLGAEAFLEKRKGGFLSIRLLAKMPALHR